jgi:hypothetical protein
MNLKDVKATYDFFSGKASDLTRQLSFAGIAIIWVLRVGDKTGGVPYSHELLIPLWGFVVALAMDFLQYVYAAIAWNRFLHWKEDLLGADSDKDFLVPPMINFPTSVFFCAKIVAAMISYAYLIKYIARVLWP